MTRTATLISTFFLSCVAAAPAAETLTYVDLVNRTIDLEHLAVLPPTGEKCAQWSSYDRASKYDEATGKYVAWGANGDGKGVIRQEGDRAVMAEMEGPGCIWRIWSARAQNGRVKIYLDGQEQPAIDMPFIHYFDGKHAPFNYSMLSYEMRSLGSAGENLYFPIPYQKSCKIVADAGWGQYYHFTYTTFAPSTKVPTFKADFGPEETAALKKVDDFFRERLGNDPAGERKEQKVETKNVTVAPGKSEKVLELSGPRAITALKQVIAKYPDTPVARLAQEELTRLDPAAAADAGGASKPAGGEAAGSAASAEKKASSYLKMAKTFAAGKPDKAREYAQKAIEAAPDGESAREAKALLERLK